MAPVILTSYYSRPCAFPFHVLQGLVMQPIGYISSDIVLFMRIGHKRPCDFYPMCFLLDCLLWKKLAHDFVRPLKLPYRVVHVWRKLRPTANEELRSPANSHRNEQGLRSSHPVKIWMTAVLVNNISITASWQTFSQKQPTELLPIAWHIETIK